MGLIKFHKTISSRIMSKSTVNPNEKALTKMELHRRYLPWKLMRFLKVILNDVFQKFISTDKQIFNISNKVTSIVKYRSSQRKCSVRKGVFRNLATVTEKYLCQSLYFNKVRPATLLKPRLRHKCFPLNFAKFLRTPFLQSTSGRPLLNVRRFGLKNKIFAGIKFQDFPINRTENYFTGTLPYTLFYFTRTIF